MVIKATRLPTACEFNARSFSADGGGIVIIKEMKNKFQLWRVAGA